MPAVQASDLTAVANELVEAFTAGDWSRFRSVVHPDVLYEETGTQVRTEGVEAYVRRCQEWKEAFPDARGTARATLASGQTVVQEIVWEGTHTGPLRTPGGTIPPTGRRIRMLGTIWNTVEDGRAREIRHHLDVLTMLQQLGLFPVPAGTP
jgi:steroid delta-isomerase-like uncharacterized protein